MNDGCGMVVARALALLLAIAALSGLAIAQAPRTGPRSLDERLAIIAREAGGTTGLAALHVESGRQAGLRAAERFPMQSVYKVAIALAVLHQVDEGTLAFDRQERFEAKDLRIGASALTERWTPPAITVSIRELLSLMVSQSDNSASDRLLALAGGADAVTSRLRALGIADVRVDRPEAQLIADCSGFALPADCASWTPDLFRALRQQTRVETMRRAVAAYLADPRDTATPSAMAQLLARLQQGRTLSPASTALLLRLLAEGQPGLHRIPGRLPPGTPAGQKAGTSFDLDGGTFVVNDVGLITLPASRGHVALAIFVKGSRLPVAKIEPVIAALAREVYDAWSADPSSSTSTAVR